MADTREKCRWDAPTLRTILNRLDRAAAADPRRDQRTWPRYAYRPGRLTLDVLDGDGRPTARCRATGRNLSRGGLSLLTDRMLYPQTRCRVRLRGPGHTERAVAAAVRHCRYVLGSGTVYELGLRFDRAIDVASILPRTRRMRVVLADADLGVADLVATFLQGMNVDLRTAAQEAREVLSAALELPADLVLIDLEDARFDALASVRALRQGGFVGAAVGLGVNIDEETYRQCLAAGCSGYLRKPLLRGALRRLVVALLDRPLVSRLAHDPAMAPLIDAFVAGLPARLRALAAAHRSGDFDELRAAAHRLRGEGGSYGFPEITEAATEVQLRVAMRESAERIEESVEALIHLGRSARPVSCLDTPGLPG